jgi:hypothetical protein
MPDDWDFTLNFTDDALEDNPEAVAWLKACEERIRQELEGTDDETT